MDETSMSPDDFFAGDEPVSEPEAPSWQAPVQCPECHGRETRFISLHHEMSVYACERCDCRFEVEES